MRTCEKFLNGYLNKEKPEYKKTLEALTAIISYKSLEEDERKEYGKYLQELEPLLFNLSPTELAHVEVSLPEYGEIEEEVYRKIGINEEDLEKIKKYRELMSNRIFKLPGLNILAIYSLRLLSVFDENLKEIINVKESVEKKIVPEEYKKILDERSKEILKSSMLISMPIYVHSAVLHYLRTLDLTVEAAYLSSVLSSNFFSSLPLLSERFKAEKYRKLLPYIRMVTLSSLGAYIYFQSLDPLLISVYLLTISLPYWILGIFESGLGYSFSDAIEKTWPYLPKKVRKALDKTRRFLGNVKIKPFNEEEIYNELYEASLRLEKVSSLPSYVFEEFRERLRRKAIKVENLEERLAVPHLLGYYRKEIVLVEHERGLRVVNRRVLEELARAYGIEVENFEREVLREPWKYLEIDVKNGKKVYGRSVIGMYNFKGDALKRGIAAKEVEACLLSLYATLLLSMQCTNNSRLRRETFIKDKKIIV